jgi:hypothetical protein
MAWEIKTYLDFMAAEPFDHPDRLPFKTIDNVNRVQCKGCNSWKLPIVMIDCRTFPTAFLSQFPTQIKFACDGCWTKWERDQISTGDGRKFNEAIMYEFASAPPAIVAEAQEIILKRSARFSKSAGAILSGRLTRNLGA